jgi:osmotically inducible protein OsmC
MIRTSLAVWHGDGQTGSGTLTSQSGVLNAQPYSFKTRFESEDGKAGTNPEELIAAAHAGCFSMALSFMLAASGFTADEIRTNAAVNILMKDGGFVIADIVLDLEAKIPGIDNDKFQEIAANAKANCPVSKALSATPITLKAKLL